jgi:hypothetical protein
MNAALCRVVFISVHPLGTYVSGMCQKSDAVGAAAAGMVRVGNWRGRGREIWFERKKRIRGHNWCQTERRKWWKILARTHQWGTLL